ncbi:cell division cycle 20-like protein 1, cofactor of APC complex [Nematocida sp. AWRm80]|nr:cell division cycle 20-like protein 1, cofactor of APC complex [Nematocida sp. AWRm80]
MDPVPISSEDLLLKCKVPIKATIYPQEYEEVFKGVSSLATKNMHLNYFPQRQAEKRTIPIRVTKVCGLADDFYSSLLDWQGNNIVFALDERVFVQNFLTGHISLLARLGSTYITSIKASPIDNIIGVGTCTGDVALIDMNGSVSIQRHVHKSRIGVMEWNGKQLLTGSRDRTIKHIDIRTMENTASVSVHTQEVCGLSFSPCKTYLATGGNDNRVFILDARHRAATVHTIEAHKAAVKAIGWCPDRSNILATGGGTADRTVKIWNVSGNKEDLVDNIDYGSQVCNLKWTRRNELITTHGYSQNDIRLLDISRKKQTRLFEGHKSRVIHFGIGADEEYFATGSGDETMRIWKVRETDLTNFLVR